MVSIENSIYTMDIHGVYRDLYIYHVQETEKQQKRNEKSMIFRFMLDGKKAYKSFLVYPFGILMG